MMQAIQHYEKKRDKFQGIIPSRSLFLNNGRLYVEEIKVFHFLEILEIKN